MLKKCFKCGKDGEVPRCFECRDKAISLMKIVDFRDLSHRHPGVPYELHLEVNGEVHRYLRIVDQKESLDG